MHELASVHKHENGYTVTLRKPPSEEKSKKYEYDAGKSHVAADHHEAAALVHGHLKGIADNQAGAAKSKTDRMDSAARSAYRALVGSGEASGEDSREDVHRPNTLRKGTDNAYIENGHSRDTKTGTRDKTNTTKVGQ